jgi:hypothetical protein
VLIETAIAAQAAVFIPSGTSYRHGFPSGGQGAVPRGAAFVSVRRDSPGLSRSIIDERALAGMADARANPEGPICCINAWWCNP